MEVSGCTENPIHCAKMESCDADSDCFEVGGNKMVCGSIKATITLPAYSSEWAEVDCKVDQKICGSIMFCEQEMSLPSPVYHDSVEFTCVSKDNTELIAFSATFALLFCIACFIYKRSRK